LSIKRGGATAKIAPPIHYGEIGEKGRTNSSHLYIILMGEPRQKCRHNPSHFKKKGGGKRYCTSFSDRPKKKEEMHFPVLGGGKMKQ